MTKQDRTTEDIIERARAEMQAGRLWRAKEILQGNAGRVYEPRICEAYGRLLLEMRDDVEAGKYLFLGGNHLPEYQPAIDLYIEKYTRKGEQYLIASFPAQVRGKSLEAFPPAVAEKLRALGYSPKLHHPATQRSGSFIGPAIGVSILLLFLAGFLNGLWLLVHFVWKLFSY